MKVNIKYFILVFLFSCQNSETIQKKIIDKQNKDDIIITDSSLLEPKTESPLESFIHLYSDSINNLNYKNILPIFLEDANFNYTHSGIWSPSHNPLPLRIMIIKQVTNCKSLNILVKSNNELYKVKSFNQYGIKVQGSQYSFYDLISSRSKELDCESIISK